jgi:hypothetical protein
MLAPVGVGPTEPRQDFALALRIVTEHPLIPGVVCRLPAVAQLAQPVGVEADDAIGQGLTGRQRGDDALLDA